MRLSNHAKSRVLRLTISFCLSCECHPTWNQLVDLVSKHMREGEKAKPTTLWCAFWILSCFVTANRSLATRPWSYIGRPAKVNWTRQFKIEERRGPPWSPIAKAKARYLTVTRRVSSDQWHGGPWTPDKQGIIMLDISLLLDAFEYVDDDCTNKSHSIHV